MRLDIKNCEVRDPDCEGESFAPSLPLFSDLPIAFIILGINGLSLNAAEGIVSSPVLPTLSLCFIRHFVLEGRDFTSSDWWCFPAVVALYEQSPK